MSGTPNETTIENYEELLFKIIHILKMELDHEGTDCMVTPTQLLDKIAGMSHGLPAIRERIYGKQ